MHPSQLPAPEPSPPAGERAAGERAAEGRATEGRDQRHVGRRAADRERERELERLLAEERAAHAHLERLHALSAALAAATTEAEVCAVLLREGHAAVGAAATGVALVVPPAAPDEPQLLLDLAASAGWPDDVVEAWGRFPGSLPDGRALPPDVNTPLADAVRRGEPVWLEGRAAAARRYPAIRALLERMAADAWLAVPFTVGAGAERRALGGFVVVLRGRDAVTAAERALLEDVAHQGGQALERARLGDVERATAAEGERLYTLEHAARGSAEEAYREASAASRAQRAFLTSLAGELRGPLEAIGGYAERLALGARGAVTDEQRADLAHLHASQQHLLGVVTDVLNFVRADAGEVRYALADVPAADALAAVGAALAARCREKGVAFAAAAADPALGARADRDRLQQVLQHLAANALAATPPGGRIEVACEARRGRGGRPVVAFQVRDGGPGLAPERLATLFEPFVPRADRPLALDGGVGLGLAVSRALSRGMGGELTAENAPGGGSVFTLTLPASAPAAPPAR